MALKTNNAIYADGKLTFSNPALVPENGAEVLVVFEENNQVDDEKRKEEQRRVLQELCGSAKGENLHGKLMEMRARDR